MICNACNHENGGSAKFCVNCGGPLASAPPVRDTGVRGGGARVGPAHAASVPAVTNKSPVVAAVLSVLIVGAGQFYNNDIKKGVIMLGIAVVAGLATVSLGWFAIALWSAYDAHQVASGLGERWN